MFCLDTNVVIAIMTGRSPQIIARLETELNLKSQLHIPTMVWFELQYGVAKSMAKERNKARLADFMLAVEPVMVFDSLDAEVAGDIRAYLEKQGAPIGPYDVLIAAQAIRLGATLVTANSREFARVPGLKLVNWA